jgi:hypothetical protein
MKFKMQSYPEKGRGIMKKGHIILGVILLIGLFVFIPNGAADDEGLLADHFKSKEEAETSSQDIGEVSMDYSSSWGDDSSSFGAAGDVDEDKDGVLDDKDKCLGTLPGVAVDEKGCPKVMEMEVMSPKHNVIYPPGEDIVVEGHVWNEEGWHPVEGVKIKTYLYVEGSEGWEHELLNPTNPEGDYIGQFLLTEIPQGIYTLRVTASKTGYPDVSKTIKNITIGGVTVVCYSDSDCDDGDPCTTDTCNNPGTSSALCSYTRITSCMDNDGCCPTGCNVNIDNDCETPVKKTQLEILKEIHEINIKSIEVAKEKAKALKDSPTIDELLDEYLKRSKEGMEEINAGLKNLDKYIEDVEQKEDIEELKVKNKKSEMKIRETESIKDIYSILYATSVIEARMKEGIIKTKDNEMKIMRLSDGKSTLLLILSADTECEVETLREDSLWVKVKKGVVGAFEFIVETQREFQHALIGDFVWHFSTDNAEVTSDHTKFETSYDPASKITTVTVFEDYVTVKSLKTNDPEMIVSAGQRIEITDDGFSPKLELSQDDLMCLADRYTVAFGGINPLLISTNNPPTASFSIMPENPTPEDTIIGASTSSDPDGDTLTYSWYRDGSEIENTPNWEWENPQAGEYNIKLVVDDGKGGSDEYSTKIKVIGPTVIPGFEIGIGTGDKTNNPPTASFYIMPQNPKTSDTIVVASTSFDPDDDKLTYSWYRDGIYLTEIGDWSDWEWENPQAGEHTIKLVVDDGKGRSDECSTKIMVIGPTDTPGFEIAFLISAIVVALIVIKRRKHNL